jgi:hypothetical protein
MNRTINFLVGFIFVFSVATFIVINNTKPENNVVCVCADENDVSVPQQAEPIPSATPQILIFFASQSEPFQNYEEPTPDSRSGLPFDQNQDGLINCVDFSDREKPGIDNLLDLAYNRYGYKYLDSNDNSSIELGCLSL